MYTNVTKHTEMKYKLHIYMQARAQSVGPLGSPSFFYSRTKATSALAQVATAAFAIGKAAWAAASLAAWVDRANESRASGSSW